MVPSGWTDVVLGEIAEVRLGATPARRVDEYWVTTGQAGHPWVAISDLSDVKWISETAETITDAGVQNSSVKLVEPGHTLVSFKLSLGKVARAGVPLYTNEAIAALVPKDGRVADDFLYYAIPKSVERATAAVQAVKGLTLNKGKLQRLSLLLPPLPEQRKIAAILSGIDDAIAATRKVIKRTKRVEQGLLQALTTRGIGHTRFKETEIGEIPQAWKVKPADNLCEKISVGIVVRPAALYVESGVPCIRSANISTAGIIDSNWVWISQESSRNHAKSILRAGDVVVVRTGEPGVACVVPDWLDECNCVDVIFARPGTEQLNPHFLALFLNSYAGRSQVLQKRGGLAQKHLNVGALKRMHIPVPPLGEQVQIIELVRSVQAAGATAASEVEAIETLKRGLIQDLLTGRVRVQPD